MIIQVGAKKKTKIDARKETNLKNKRHQREYRQAVDEFTSMGANKLQKNNKNNAWTLKNLYQEEHGQAVDDYTRMIAKKRNKNRRQ